MLCLGNAVNCYSKMALNAAVLTGLLGSCATPTLPYSGKCPHLSLRLDVDV